MPRTNENEYRTLTYTFDKANNQIKIYVDGEKKLTYNTSKFIADIPDLSTVYLGRTQRRSLSSWPFNGEVYFAGFTPTVLSDDDIANQHTNLVQEHNVALQNAEIKQRIFQATPNEKYPLFVAGQKGANNYRIPALLNTKDNVLIAAIDKRNQHGADWGNIDTVIRRSLDGGKTWLDDQVLIDLVQQPYGSENAAFLIDPQLVQDKNTGRIFMLIDMFPEIRGFFGLNSARSEGSGYKTIDGKHYRLLTDDQNNQYTVRENGIVYDEYNQPTTLRVVIDGNPETGFHDLGDLYNGEQRLGNVFLQTDRENNDSAPLKALATSYLWLIHSDDNGKTWSNPKDITPQVKADWMRFMGTGPGNGIQLKNGSLIMPIYYTNSNGKQSAAVIISKDGGETWQRGESPVDRLLYTEGGSRYLNNNSEQITESQLVELDSGELKLFSRNLSGRVRISTSKDGGYTWLNHKERDDILVDPYSQLSIIKYSKRINGKEYVIFANPHASKRVNGKVWLGEVQDDGSITWKYNTTITTGSYAYNSLTELPNGDIGLLYEESNQKIQYVSVSLQELLWQDNIIHRDIRKEALTFNYDSPIAETFYKIGDGEMIKQGVGANPATLIVNEGTATLAQSADNLGNKQAFAKIIVNETGKTRLTSPDQIDFNQLYLNGGTLDLNAQNVTLAQEKSQGTGLYDNLIAGNIVNHNEAQEATLNYQLTGTKQITGLLGDEYGKLNLHYHPSNSDDTLVLYNHSQLNNLNITTGSLIYGENATHNAEQININNQGNLYLLGNTSANLNRLTLNADTNFVIHSNNEQTVNLQTNSQGEGNLYKTGEGTLTLQGELNHSGISHFMGGVVNLRGTIQQSEVIVASNTTLSGNGKINSKTIWENNSLIMPNIAQLTPINNTPSATDSTSVNSTLTFNHVENQGAKILLNVVNQGNAIENWQSDKILIHGELRTNQAIPVSVRLSTSEIGESDTNHNGKYDANEGISLIQVAGDNNKMDQFKLGDILTKSANDIYHFALVNIEKGVSLSEQNQLGNDSNYYDYRLQTQLIGENGNLLDPHIYKPVAITTPNSPTNTLPPTASQPSQQIRAHIDSRIAAYLVAQPALLSQGNSLHQQFMKNLWLKQKKGFYVEQQYQHTNYTSNLSFSDYGYNYKATQHSTLFGGYIPFSNNTELHTGLALSQQKVNPQSIDGDSTTKYKTTSLFGALHHQWDKWSLNNSLSYHWHNGKIATAYSGNRIKAQQIQFNTELAYQIPLDNFSIIPVTGFGYQHLRTHISGDNHWAINTNNYHILTQYVGSHFTLNNHNWSLKAGAVYEHNNESKGKVNVEANQQAQFMTGKLGNALHFTGSINYAITPQLKLGVQFSHRHSLSQAKLKQDSVSLKLNYQF